MLKRFFTKKQITSLIIIFAILPFGFLIYNFTGLKDSRSASVNYLKEYPLPQKYSIRYFKGQKHINNYTGILKKYMLSEQNAGIYASDLSGQIVFTELNSDKQFNPASLIKILTSSKALSKWGPNHRFTTSLIVDKKRIISGSIRNVEIYTDGDPLIRSRDMQMAFNKLRAEGIKIIRDTLFVHPLVKVNSIHNERDTRYILNKLLRRAGIRLYGKIIFKQGEITHQPVIAQRKSPELLEILHEMNAHSINSIADRLGNALGGPGKLVSHLFNYCLIDTTGIKIVSSSGLGINRITPKQFVEALTKFKFQLDSLNIPLELILPAMGKDGSTVGNRLREMNKRGTILAKTGTLIATDDGVSSLAGFINTGDFGILPFCIMNFRGEVSFLIKQQNYFLREFLQELNTSLIEFPEPEQKRFWIYSARPWQTFPSEKLFEDIKFKSEIMP